jgi:hypothetical protein
MKRQKVNAKASMPKPKRRWRKKGMCLEDRPVLEPNAAGIDVGAREMFVAVAPGRDESPVRVFATFTENLEQLADWLAQCGVTTVAMCRCVGHNMGVGFCFGVVLLVA